MEKPLQLEIGLNYHFHESTRFEHTAGFAVTVLSSLGFVGCVLFLLLKLLILRPLAKLQHAMDSSRPESPIAVTALRNDEIGHAGDAYNRLADAARQFFTDLSISLEQLRNSEARFKDMAEISGDWFFEMDEQLRFSYHSKRFFELTGLSPDDVLYKRRDELAETTSGEQGSEWQNHLNDLAAARPFRNFEYALELSYGKKFYLSASGKPIFDEKGVFAGYRGTGTDITSLHLKERELAEANRNFGDSVSYASRYQHRLLSRPEDISACFGRAELVWQPRDMVGGDFVTHRIFADTSYLIFFDCTGHGVPGAFMTMIVLSALDRIMLTSAAPPSVDALMKALHEQLCIVFGLDDSVRSGDGLECAIIAAKKGEQHIDYCGVGLDLFCCDQQGGVTRLIADRGNLGYHKDALPALLTTHHLAKDGQSFVLVTDGITTQIGQEHKRVMGTARLIAALEGASKPTASGLVNAVMLCLRRWQGREVRRDDVTILAFTPEQLP